MCSPGPGNVSIWNYMELNGVEGSILWCLLCLSKDGEKIETPKRACTPPPRAQVYLCQGCHCLYVNFWGETQNTHFCLKIIFLAIRRAFGPDWNSAPAGFKGLQVIYRLFWNQRLFISEVLNPWIMRVDLYMLFNITFECDHKQETL